MNERFFVADIRDRMNKVTIRYNPHERPKETHRSEDEENEAPSDMWANLNKSRWYISKSKTLQRVILVSLLEQQMFVRQNPTQSSSWKT